MTEDVLVHPPLSEELPRPTGRTRRTLRIGLIVLAAIASAPLVLIPAAHLPGSPDLRAGALAGLAAVAVAAAWPVHRRAWGSVWPVRIELVASITMLLALAWSLARAVDVAGPDSTALAAITVALTSTVAEELRAADLDSPEVRMWWLVPLVLAVAGAVLVGWSLSDGLIAGAGRALSVLVVATPTALVLASVLPTVLLRRRAQALGVRLPGRSSLARAARVDTVVLDKDGTVTTGALRVSEVAAVEPDHERNLKWFAGALAHGCSEPEGRAIATLSGRGHLVNFRDQPGLGFSGSIDRHPVRVGRPDWVGLPDPGGVGTTFGVEVDGRALGHIKLVDQVRPQAADAVRRLRSLGMTASLVSSANQPDTARIAEEVGITDFVARASAAERAAQITHRRDAGAVVAYLGAGAVNSEPLAAADLAISTAAAGRDALGVRELDLSHVVLALRLARGALAPVRLLQMLALLGLVIPTAAAAAGLLTPLIASGVALATCGVLAVTGWAMVPRVGAGAAPDTI